jgi:hypothetical protein
MESIDPDKYITFKRDDWDDFVTNSTDIAPGAGENFAQLRSLPDAVVIRRQDLFAGPALHAYSASIAIASKLNSDPELTKSLRNVADYFHEQAVLADAEGWKLPD